MKTIEEDLELQAYADGQLHQLEGLAPGRRAEIERLVGRDAEARAVVDGLRSISQMLRANEPVHSVPASREFYWSQIQRRIQIDERAVDRAAATQHPAHSVWSWRWLAPVLGLGTIMIAIALVSRGDLPGSHPLGEIAVSERGSDNSGAVVFRSESEGVTICWLD